MVNYRAISKGIISSTWAVVMAAVISSVIMMGLHAFRSELREARTYENAVTWKSGGITCAYWRAQLYCTPSKEPT